MKIPKKLKMFGYDWKVTLYDGEGDSSYNWSKLEIKVAKKWAEEELMHELLEAVLVSLQFRFYGQEGGMEKQFFFNHTGLCQVHKELYAILKTNKLI